MTTGPTLRSYQTAGVTAIRARFAEGASRVLFQSPTGSGKTVLFAFIVQNAAVRGNRVILLGHRQEIFEQIAAALTELGVPHGIIAAGYSETLAPVQVASVATLVRRLDRLQHGVDLLVIDEAHHAVAGTWSRILTALPNTKVLGVTATPERLDGKGLGEIFDTLVIGPAVAELIEHGYLAPFTTYAPSRALDLSRVRTRMGDYAVDQLADVMSDTVVIGSAVDEYARLCPGAPAVAFCVDIKHSETVAERFADAGYRAAHVDGETDKSERRKLIQALASGNLQTLTNCGLVSEGLDVPGVVAVILLRPTRSLTLHLQQVGRALRPASSKAKALILVHAQNSYRHGLPDAPRTWSLDGRAQVRSPEPVVRRCPECGALVPIAALRCNECGIILREPAPPVPRIEVRSGSLVEINHMRSTSYRQAMRWAGESEDRLRLVASARGYKRGWVFHRLREMREEIGDESA